jgi:hypothetical protein
MAEDVLEVERCVEGAALWLLGEFKAALATLQRDEDARASDVKVAGDRKEWCLASSSARGDRPGRGAPLLRAGQAAAPFRRSGLQAQHNMLVAQYYAAEKQDPQALVASLLQVRLGNGAGATQTHPPGAASPRRGTVARGSISHPP